MACLLVLEGFEFGFKGRLVLLGAAGLGGEKAVAVAALLGVARRAVIALSLLSRNVFRQQIIK